MSLVEAETAALLRAAADIQRCVASAQQRLAAEAARLAEDRRAFDEAVAAFEAKRERAACVLARGEHSVALNVGGTLFETSRQALLAEPDSMLAMLLSSWFAVERDAEENIFIDRSPKWFPRILQYLRCCSNCIVYLPSSAAAAATNPLTVGDESSSAQHQQLPFFAPAPSSSSHTASSGTPQVQQARLAAELSRFADTALRNLTPAELQELQVEANYYGLARLERLLGEAEQRRWVEHGAFGESVCHRAHSDMVLCMSADRDAGLLFAGSADCCVSVFQLAAGPATTSSSATSVSQSMSSSSAAAMKLQTRFQAHTNFVTAVTHTPTLLITGSRDMNIAIFLRPSVTTATAAAAAFAAAGPPPPSAAALQRLNSGSVLSSVGSAAALATQPPLHVLQEYRLLRTFNAHADFVQCLAVRPAAATVGGGGAAAAVLVSGAGDGCVRVWNLDRLVSGGGTAPASGGEQHRSPSGGGAAPVRSPPLPTVAMGSPPPQGVFEPPLAHGGSPAAAGGGYSSAAAAANAAMTASVALGHSVRCVALFGSVAFVGCGDDIIVMSLVGACGDGSTSGAAAAPQMFVPAIETLRVHTAPIRCLAINDDRGLLCSGSWDNKIFIWDAAAIAAAMHSSGGISQRPVSAVPPPALVRSGSAQLMAPGSSNNGAAGSGLAGATALLFGGAGSSATDTAAASGRPLSTAAVAATPLMSLHGCPDWVAHVAFVGPFLVAASKTLVLFFDLETRLVVRTVATGHTDIVRCFVADARADMLVTGSFDHTIRLFRGTNGNPPCPHCGLRPSDVA